MLLSTGCARSTQNSAREGTEAPDYLDSREQEIARELNELRRDPAVYANRLEQRREFYDGNLLRLPGQVPVRTEEGVSAVNEAIDVLRSEKPLPSLATSKPLSLAAGDHVADLGPKGLVSHKGSDNSSPSDRVLRYAAGTGTVGEVISFGPDQPASVVFDLLVDDGVPDRGHRVLLLDVRFQRVGIACGGHRNYRTMCVIMLSDGLQER